MIKKIFNGHSMKAILIVLFSIAAGTFSINSVASDKAGAKKGKIKLKKHTHCHRHQHKHGWTKKTRKVHNHRHCHNHIHFYRNPRHGYKLGKSKLHKATIHKDHHSKKRKKSKKHK